MSTSHLQPGDVAALAATQAGRAHALFKGRDLEVMRLVLAAGECLPPHAVPGEATVQCLTGRLAVALDGGVRELAQGELLYLGRAARHGVQALADSVALVTLALVAATPK